MMGAQDVRVLSTKWDIGHSVDLSGHYLNLFELMNEILD